MKNTFFSITPYNENVIKNRQDYNQQIVNLLSWYVEKYPDIRFGQLLVDIECVPDSQSIFYEESKNTLERIQNSLNKTKI